MLVLEHEFVLKVSEDSMEIHRGSTDNHLPWSSYQAGSVTIFAHTRTNYVAAMDALDKLSASLPRKYRKSVRELLDSVEELSESVDDAWCDGVSRCSPDRLEALASQMLAVQGLTADRAASDCVSAVSSLLEAIRECGSVAVQCESVLSAESDEA